MKRLIFIALGLVCFINACKLILQKEIMFLDSKETQNVITKITDIVVYDVTNPPLDARFYPIYN